MENLSSVDANQSPGSWRGYISSRASALARPDHWSKNAFLLPGVALALVLSGEPLRLQLAWRVLVVLAVTSLVASANYTINEWLDAGFDRFHLTKRTRSDVSTRML